MMLLLFVCTGNTCRSPLAEALLRLEWGKSKRKIELEIASAGLAARAGEKASWSVRELLRREGIDLEAHTATSLDRDLLHRASLILVMTAAQRDLLLERYPGAEDKTYLLKEFAGDRSGNPDIEDPFGGSLDKYHSIMEEISRIIPKIIISLEGGVMK